MRRHNQTFETKEQGLKHYAGPYNAAIDGRDNAKALELMLRILELRAGEDPRFYSNSARILFHMGDEVLGDRAILRHADLCKRRGLKKRHIIMHKLFIDYSLRCRNLEKAVPSAQEVMKAETEYVPAMAVEMLRIIRTEGDTAQAKKLAQRIVELEQDIKNPWRQLAEKALAVKSED